MAGDEEFDRQVVRATRPAYVPRRPLAKSSRENRENFTVGMCIVIRLAGCITQSGLLPAYDVVWHGEAMEVCDFT